MPDGWVMQQVGAGDDAGLLRDWLLRDALPFWAEHGVDRRDGGFFERLDDTGRPIEEPRRARLVGRQIYCFAIGHELGWDGPAGELIQHGLDFLRRRLLRPDGTVIGAVSVDGWAEIDRYDPYDYAFVLLALATAARQLGDRPDLHELALAVRCRLVKGWSHPLAGFEEASPRTLPLKQNPHMHLFEAFLAWDEVMGGSEPSWREHADRLAILALGRLISPETGALPEFFDGDWRPVPDAQGLQIEPGHQFEWSWLLLGWLGDRSDERTFAAAARLAEIGERFGVAADRNVAIGTIDEHFAIRDAEAKLWPQTERLKAWHRLGRHPLASEAERLQARGNAAKALAGLTRYLAREPAGSWHEIIAADGHFVPGPVRASSLYHLACAVHALSGPPA